MYDDGDILLFALSAGRNTPWRVFKQYFEEVHRRSVTSETRGPDGSASSHRWGVLRSLSCLGHIDLRFPAGDIQVVVAPAALALLPNLRSHEAILCGGRSPWLIDRLVHEAAKADVEVSIKSQASVSPYAPSRILARGKEVASIRQVAGNLGIHFMDTPPARLLSTLSISLEDYIRGLTYSDARELNWYREDYDSQRMSFREGSGTSLSNRLSRYRDPVSSIPHHRLWCSNRSAEIHPDWGRYAILALSSKQVLRYAAEHRQVFVPAGAPLPTLLAKSLALCGGHYPELVQLEIGGTSALYSCYKHVPPSIYEVVSSKVEDYGE